MSAIEIEVIKAGALSTVQDLGRFGYAHLGISPTGAADSLSLRIANRLVGNDDNAAGLEMTLLGATLRFRSAGTIALTGAEIATNAVTMLEPVTMSAGSVLDCGALRDGARTYLAIAGGITVPRVLDSASTHLAAGFGGFYGRPLKHGDVLNAPGRKDAARVADPAPLRAILTKRATIRFTKGPHQDWFGAEALSRFCASTYTVSSQSNRSGLRLAGEAVLHSQTGELLTEGVAVGAIQIPPDGQPIVLFVDQQTTGGYPILGNIISTDLHYVGQLRPHDTVRFELISIEDALIALHRQERALAEAFGK